MKKAIQLALFCGLGVNIAAGSAGSGVGEVLPKIWNRNPHRICPMTHLPATPRTCGSCVGDRLVSLAGTCSSHLPSLVSSPKPLQSAYWLVDPILESSGTSKYTAAQRVGTPLIRTDSDEFESSLFHITSILPAPDANRPPILSGRITITRTPR
ncbi:MAG: hypothetical protein LBJ92_03325 [Holosporales bacterium]|jgi:hypothetical protein|nr:hypothetical protein [Holosporales bacterium]